MNRTASIIFFTAFIFNYSFAQETYNLEIIFKTGCPLDSMEMFGFALSSAGDVNNDGFDDIIIGSRTLIWAGIEDTSPGHAYIYLGGASVDTIVDISLPGEHPLDLFAFSVAGLGDINCDSFDDVAVSAPNCSQIDSCGRVYIYFGGTAMDSVPDLILKGTFCAAFGCGIASGDINNDSWNDIIVGEYWWGSGNGRVYIYYGGPLLDTIPDVIINGHNGESMGITVGSGGDLNDDGFDDIVAGAFNNGEGGFWAGKVYVFLGGNPIDTIPDCWLHGEEAGHSLGLFGCDIMRAQGGYDRLITSTRFYDGNSYGRGKVYILYGGDPMDSIPDVWMTGSTDSSSLGRWCSSAGDIDGDGYEEALAGAPNDFEFSGCGYIWLGDMPMDSIEDAYLKGNINFYGIGWKVASAGDVNGDGYDEVIFSNYASDSNQTIWVCRYTGGGLAEQKAKSIGHSVEIYPNPAKGMLTIRFNSPNERKVTVKLYDVTGRLVDEILNGKVKMGTNEIPIRSKELSAGVYFVRLETEDYKKTEKVILLK